MADYERFYLRDLDHIDEPILWASAPVEEDVEPSPENARFLLQSTLSPLLWEAAVRGVNYGDWLGTTVAENDIIFVLDQNGQPGPYDVIDDNTPMISLEDDAQIAAYLAAIQQPGTGRGDLAVQVLEQQRRGVWNLEQKNDAGIAEPVAQLVYKSPEEIGVRWPDDGQLYMVDLAREGKGPLFSLEPRDAATDHPPIGLNLLYERTRVSPVTIHGNRTLLQADLEALRAVQQI
jgi:hypothetical protein